jgi:hypothetical protein
VRRAFAVDAGLAVCGLIVSVLFVGGTVEKHRIAALRHHHRAHTP